MSEQWLPVVGYEDCYEVSDQGRVRSFQRLVRHKHGGWRVIQSCILHASVNPLRGYMQVGLWKDNKHKTVVIHKLVTEAFFGKCPKGYEVAHLDGVPSNSVLSNLRYATPKENQGHRKLHGTYTKGDNHPTTKLKERDVLDIHELLSLGVRIPELAKEFGVTRSNISLIKNGKSRASIAL